MLLNVLASNFGRALVTNATNTSFASRIPTISEPSGAGVINVANIGLEIANGFYLVPFGAGADDATFSMRVLGWRPAVGLNTNLWVPTPIFEATCTLSAAVGIAGATCINTDRFCDLIVTVANRSTANVSSEIISPDGDLIGHVILNSKGCPKIEFQFNTGSSATNCNCLFARL